MKKRASKISKGNSSSKMSTSRFIIGIVLGIIIGLVIGGTVNLTGNVVGGCATDYDSDGYEGPGGDNSDCNDNNYNVYPGNTEMCGDSLDNDCDSTTLDTCAAGESCDTGTGTCSMTDDDFDGYGASSDCNDNDANIYPGNTEMCGDSLDNDCDSTTLDTCSVGETCDTGTGTCSMTDDDFDGYDVNSDCNDNDPNIYPGNWEQCGDSIDNDCDSSTLDTCATGESCSAGICMPNDENIPPV